MNGSPRDLDLWNRDWDSTIHGESSTKFRVLLVEDHPLNRLLLLEYLSYCNYDTMALADGLNLFSVLNQFQPHALILDLKLPGIDGYHLIRDIKLHPRWHTLPIIVVTALAFANDQRRATDLGIKDYFVKPVNLAQLTQRLHHVICLTTESQID